MAIDIPHYGKSKQLKTVSNPAGDLEYIWALKIYILNCIIQYIHLLLCRQKRPQRLYIKGINNNASLDYLDSILLNFPSLRNSKLVIVSPSMSGTISLPYLFERESKISGFVAVAPVGSEQYQSKYNRLKGKIILYSYYSFIRAQYI